MQLKHSQSPSINIAFYKIICAFGLFPRSYYFTKHTSAITVHMPMYDGKCACTCTDSGYRCCSIQSISLGFKALTGNQTRLLSSHSPSLQHPSQPQKYYQSFPREKQRGNVIWKRGANPPQQQLFPNHNNLGKGCGLYFMGGEGPRMFIYLSPQSALRCVCVLVCVCDKLSHSSLSTFTGTRLRSLVTPQSSETSATASHVCR